jgi:hypothetical protein
MVVRQWDWERRLHRYIAATQATPFALGQQDCALWALGAVDAMCGTALAAPFVGTYDTLDGARAVFAARGWAAVADAAAALVGPRLAHVALAQRGDVLCLPPRDAEPLGIAMILGDGVIWGAGMDGAHPLPLRVTRVAPFEAFRVGR